MENIDPPINNRFFFHPVKLVLHIRRRQRHNFLLTFLMLIPAFKRNRCSLRLQVGSTIGKRFIQRRILQCPFEILPARHDLTECAVCYSHNFQLAKSSRDLICFESKFFGDYRIVLLEMDLREIARSLRLIILSTTLFTSTGNFPRRHPAPSEYL